MKKFLSLVLSVALLLSLVSIPALAEDTYREPMTLTVFDELANYAGIQPGWFAKEIEDRFNLKLNVISTNLDPNAYQTTMSSGDLGDLVIFGDMGEHFVTALKANMLLDWNEVDMTPYENINSLTTAAQAKVSKFALDNVGLDGVWGFGHDIALDANSWNVVIEPNYGMQARWDAYVAAGMPTLDTIDDLVPFLKALQEAYPVNENGEKVYAYGGFPDWEDSVMKFTWDLMTWYGYAEYDFMGVNWGTGEVVNPLEEGSLYQKMLSINNQLYREGLFDPESISQNFDAYSQKLSNGRYLMALWGWLAPAQYNTEEHIANKQGFMQIQIGDDKPVVTAGNVNGENRIWAIGANCQDPDRVLELIDWLCSTEGIMINHNGPQGLCWDYDENGMPYGTDFGWTAWRDQKNTDMPAEYGGGKYEDGESKLNNTTAMKNAYDPAGFCYNHEAWEDGIAKLSNPLRDDWSENYAGGARTGVEMLKQTGNYSVHPATSYAYADKGDDLNNIRAQFAPIMKEYSWKCVYAATDEEFNTLWAEMVQKCKDFGYDQVVEFYLGEIANKLEAIAAGI